MGARNNPLSVLYSKTDSTLSSIITGPAHEHKPLNHQKVTAFRDHREVSLTGRAFSTNNLASGLISGIDVSRSVTC
jgi:hypothetical protein